jgi:hypothetical protein
MPCQPPVLIQALSFIGALLILIAYAGHQMGWMRSQSATYNILNAVGSGILGYIAFRPFQLGFVVMETAWVVLSLWALWKMRAGRAPAQKA